MSFARLWTLARLLACIALSVATTVHAQPTTAADLEFPKNTTEFGFFTQVRMAVFKPAGDGPFPALVLHHQCGGLRAASGWQNQSMLEWAKTAVSKGYVALLIDSLGPRGVDTVCMGAKGGVTFPRGVRDAYQAAAHLRSLPYVDPQRVVWAGYSWGAMAATLGASQRAADTMKPLLPFRAAVAFYPGCATVRPASGQPYEIARSDIATPLLVLMGEDDNETPPEECVQRLQEAQRNGAPVQWHVYPKTTHCWDCANLNGMRKVDIRGTSVTYLYSKEATEDSARRMFEFFDQAFKR